MAVLQTVLRMDDPIDLNRASRGNISIDRILECAIALNWNGLAQADETTAMQVEYRIRTEPLLGVPQDLVIDDTRLLESSLRILDAI